MVNSKQVENTQLDLNVNLTSADEIQQGFVRNKTPYFSQPSAILLGAVPGGKLVVQAFKIGEADKIAVFNRANMPDAATMYTTAPKRLDSFGAVITSTLETRNNTATEAAVDTVKNAGRGFQGLRVRIPIPTGAAAKLKVPFTPAAGGSTKKRRNVFVVFPKSATKRAIAMWIATHVDATYKSEMNTFYMPSGTKCTFDPVKLDVTDPAAITALLGNFSTKYKNRLLEQPAA